MPLTLSCEDLGSPCTEAYISGDSVEELIEAMRAHAVEKHGRTMEELHSPDMEAVFRSAIRQSSRPVGARTLKLDI